MAAQVNKKFVITLSAIIGALVIAAGAAGVYAIKNSGARHAKHGDKLIAEGKIEDAYKSYGRAVNKDQTRADWLVTYRDLILQTTPDTREELERRYRLYLGTLRKLSIAQPNDPESLMAFIRERHERLQRMGWNPDLTKEFIDEADSLSGIIESSVTDREGNFRPDADPASVEAIKTVRWYLAEARLELARRSPVEESEREENRKALEQIVKEQPANDDALIYLAMWHLDEADRAYRQGLKQQESELRQQADQIFAQVLEKFPDSLYGRMMDLGRRQVDIARTITEPGARRRAFEGLAPQAEQTLAVFNAMNPDQVDFRLFEAARTILPRILGKPISAQMVEMGERIYLKKPDKPWIALTYARMLMDAERFDTAVEVLDAVLSQKKMPVSLEAMLQPYAQTAAFAERVDASLYAAERAENSQEWIARADRYMKEFEAAASADDEASVKLRRAKVAMIKNNYASAIRDLSDLEQLGLAEAAEIKYMLAVCLHKQNNFTGARERLQSMVDAGNISIQAIGLLADTQMRLNEFEGARKTLEDAIRIFPAAAEDLERQLNTVKAALGEDVQLDPAAKALVDARSARIEGDLDAARQIIADAIKVAPDNARLYDELIQIELAAKNRAEAQRLAQAAIAKWPDNANFKQYEIFARVEDENQAMLEWIETSPGTPVEKALRRYSVYARMNDTDAALRQLDLAEKAEPDNSMVINERFSRALAEEDFETARKYASKAATLNLDNLNGALFQGRMELAQRQFGPAVTTFQAAAKRIPHAPGVWSLLGDAQVAAGQIDGATESYNRALQIRGGDADIALRYARALLRVGRGPEALAVLDEVLRISPQRGEIYDLWIALQGAYGDRDSALAQRATLFERDPMATENSVSYFALLLEDNQWQRAAEVLSTIQNDPNVKEITLIDMGAKLLAGRGDIDAGAKAYQDFLKEKGADATTRDMIAYGQFLERYNRPDDALAVYRDASKRQTQGQFDADISISNTLIARSNALSNQIDSVRASGDERRADELAEQRVTLLREAADSMRRIIDAGGDDPNAGMPVHRSFAVVLADLKQYDEAEKLIAKVAANDPDKDNDLQVMLLRARIAAAKDDLRDARRILDQAADKHPGNFEPYWQRAQLNRDDPALAASVIRDLAKVTQLRPGMTEAWGLWFDLYRSQGRLADAISTLRNGVAANPAVRELRQFLVFQLLDLNRINEALEVAVEGTRQKTDQAFWYRTAGELYGRENLWQQALPLYQQLYESDKTTENAISYLDIVLRQTTPTPGTVQQLLAVLPPDNEMDLRTVMVASRARAFFKQRDRSQRLARLGFDLVGDDWRGMAYWLGQASLAEGSVENAMRLASSFQPSLEVTVPLLILGGNQLMASGARPDDVLSRISALDAVELQTVPRFEYLRLKAKLYYLDSPIQDYEKSAAFNKQALELNPNALDVTNDLAYTLAEDLGRPAEGLPYAERAVALAPDTPTVLDTLGWVYYAMGRNEDAARTLQRAVDRAQGRDNSDEYIAIVHLGIVKAELGDTRAAQQLLSRAETLLKLDPTIRNYYPTALDELKAALN